MQTRSKEKYTAGVGTFLYMAREVQFGKYTETTDIFRFVGGSEKAFSLGVVFFKVFNSLGVSDPETQA